MSIDRLAALLLHHPPFDELSREEREHIVRAGTTRTVTAGAPILVDGGPGLPELASIFHEGRRRLAQGR